MIFRALGRTGIRVSIIAFGAGPVPALLTTGGDDGALRDAVVGRALELGINWFDTAASYGEGRSERHLGLALRHFDAAKRVHLATKVRLEADDLTDIPGAVRRSFEGSLERLGVARVSLLQLHNSVTRQRGDLPTSITPDDVFSSRGVLAAMNRLKDEGLVEHLGFTGLGHPAEMRQLVASQEFATVQIPFSLANPTAAFAAPPGYAEDDYGELISDCRTQEMGVFAIRVFAGGALLNERPSEYTHRTRFFSLDLYRRDRERASRIAERVGPELTVADAAVRFSVHQPGVTAGIIGFNEPGQIDAAVHAAERGPLERSLGHQLVDLATSPGHSTKGHDRGADGNILR